MIASTILPYPSSYIPDENCLQERIVVIGISIKAIASLRKYLLLLDAIWVAIRKYIEEIPLRKCDKQMIVVWVCANNNLQFEEDHK